MRYLHAGITVRDVARSRLFYEELLGLKPVTRPEMGFPGVWYGVGDLQLHLMVPPEGRPVGESEGPFQGRVRHLALGVSGWESLVARLRTAQVPIRESAPAGPGFPRRVFVKDPDGNVLELVDDN